MLMKLVTAVRATFHEVEKVATEMMQKQTTKT
jgi:hypothetical protein